jgi:1,4-alpha-glucan branching enzyme
MSKTSTKSQKTQTKTSTEQRKTAGTKPADGSTKATPTLTPGMGAFVVKTDDTAHVVFRVWAPNAEEVSVVGDFNDWSPAATPLAHEGNGYWAGREDKAHAGNEYKFRIKSAAGILERVDPYARQVTNSVGNGVIYEDNFDWQDEAGNDTPFTLPPWNELVIYEMHIGTFNDNDVEDAHPGTFPEAIERLDYLQSLGVNVIEIMPPMEFAGDRSWGYNPAHIFAVESIYGGPDAFKQFIKEAHRRGIGVILDVVYNHFGPSDLDLWRFDGWSENEKGGIYFYNDERAETAWGATRPDYGRPEVRQFIRDNALMWLSDYRLDGLRWDSTINIRNRHGNDNSPATDIPEGWSLMQWINDEIGQQFPGKLTIAEDLQNNAWITKTTGEGGAGFGAQWDAQFVHTIRAAIIGGDDAFRDLDAVAAALTFRYNNDATDRVIYTESHDEVANGRARVPEEVTPGEADSWFAKKRSALGAVLTFTAPGIPMIFQGQEFLTDRWFEDSQPLDWSRRDQHAGMVQLYRDLIGLRRNLAGQSAALCGQEIHVYHIDQSAKVLAFARWDDRTPERNVVVIVNFANNDQVDYPIALPAGGEWRVLFNSDATHYDDAFGGQGGATVTAQDAQAGPFPYWGTVTLAPYSALILAQE